MQHTSKKAVDLKATFHSIVDEKDIQGIVVCNSNSISFYKLDDSRIGNSGKLKGFLVWKKKASKDCFVVYFQGRKKLIAFIDTRAKLLDIYTGTTEYVQECKHILTENPLCVLQDCIQNQYNHNAVQYSDSSVIITRDYYTSQICSFSWKNKLEIKISNWNHMHMNSYRFFGGKLWTAANDGIYVFEVDLASFNITKIDQYCKDIYMNDLVQYDGGVIAEGEPNFYVLNDRGEIIRTINFSWPYGSATVWKGKLVCTSCISLFDDYEHNDDKKALFVVDPKTGITFKSAWQRNFYDALCIWKNMLCIVDDFSIEYRTGKSMIMSVLNAQVTTPWVIKRLLWIGHTRNSPASAYLLPCQEISSRKYNLTSQWIYQLPHAIGLKLKKFSCVFQLDK